MANDASMVFRIKGDASHVKRELSTLGVSASRTIGSLGRGVTGALQGNFSALSGGISAVGGGLSMLGPKGMVAAAAISAVAGAASAATAGLFALTKQAAEYGSKISDLSDKTGIGAEALTSLDYAARISGTSIDEVASSLTRFNKLAGEAAMGSEEAQKKLENLGITPQEAMTDLEGALGKVFRRIRSMPPGVQQTKLAMDAFGRSGANLLPMIATMDGDLDGLIAKAKELGVTFDNTAAQEMDKFDDMLVQIGMQFEGLKRTIGIEFLPLFMEVVNEISQFIKDNQKEIKQLASDVAGVFRIVMEGLRGLVAYVKSSEFQAFWSIYKNLSGFGVISGVLSLGRSFSESRPPTPTTPSPLGGAGTIDDLYNQMAQEQKVLQERLRALDAYYKLETEQVRGNYERILAIKLEQLRTGEISENEFRAAYSEATTRFYNHLRSLVRAATALQLQDENLTAEQRRNILKRQQIDIAKLNDEEVQGRRRTLEAVEAINRQIVQSEIDRVNRESALSIKYQQAKMAEMRSTVQLQTARKEMTEGQGMAIMYRMELQMIDLLIKQTQNLLNIQRLSREERKQFEAELSLLESQRIALVNDITRAGVEGAERQAEAARQATAERVALEGQVSDVIYQREQAARDAEIRELEVILETAKNKKAVLGQIEALEAIRAQKEQEYILERLEREREASLESIAGKENEEELKFQIEELYRQKRLLAEEEFQRRLQEIRNKFGGMDEQAVTFKDTVTSLGDALKKSFGAIANGIGQAVSAWVLYGETGGAVMRKVVAESLAALAQQAAVEAIIWTAKGFGFLAMKQYDDARNAFKSAALWGAAGVAAGVGGRAIAGDSFKKESGRESVSGRSTNSGNANQGQAYSSMQDQTVDMNRAGSFGAIQRETVLVVKDKSGMFSKLFQVEVEKNSKVRQSILRMA
jgi:hypothetical protein